jgi:hypothetical protein
MRGVCYRKTAKPSSYQTYFAAPPGDEKGNCDHFWPNNEQIYVKYDAFDNSFYLSPEDWEDGTVVNLGEL